MSRISARPYFAKKFVLSDIFSEKFSAKYFPAMIENTMTVEMISRKWVKNVMKNLWFSISIKEYLTMYFNAKQRRSYPIVFGPLKLGLGYIETCGTIRFHLK